MGVTSPSDPVLILAALYAGNVATMARVRRSLHLARIATKFLLPLHLQRAMGDAEDLSWHARLIWDDTLQLLEHLAQVFDRMVVPPRGKRCTLHRNLYQRSGMWRGRPMRHLHESFRLPVLQVRIARRTNLQVLALAY